MSAIENSGAERASLVYVEHLISSPLVFELTLPHSTVETLHPSTWFSSPESSHALICQVCACPKPLIGIEEEGNSYRDKGAGVLYADAWTCMSFSLCRIANSSGHTRLCCKSWLQLSTDR